MNLNNIFMNLSTSSIKSTIISFGLLLGLISVIFQVMLYFLDMHYKNDSTAGIVSLIIMIGILFYSFTQFKKSNDGFISLSEALKIGIGASLVSALVGVLYTQILINFIDPDTMTKSLELSMETMRIQNPEMPQEAFDTVRSIQEKMSSPLVLSAVQIIFALFFGFIISLIVGLIIKKSKP